MQQVSFSSVDFKVIGRDGCYFGSEINLEVLVFFYLSTTSLLRMPLNVTIETEIT
jgi:hypothetical protein